MGMRLVATDLVSECTPVLIDEFSSAGLSCACLHQHGWELRSPVKERIGQRRGSRVIMAKSYIPQDLWTDRFQGHTSYLDPVNLL